MKTAIYMARYPGEAYDADMARAEAFCAANGLVPMRTYGVEMVQDKGQVDAFLRAAAKGEFGVVAVPFPDCFATRIVKGLFAANVGLACYGTAPVRPSR